MSSTFCLGHWLRFTTMQWRKNWQFPRYGYSMHVSSFTLLIQERSSSFSGPSLMETDACRHLFTQKNQLNPSNQSSRCGHRLKRGIQLSPRSYRWWNIRSSHRLCGIRLSRRLSGIRLSLRLSGIRLNLHLSGIRLNLRLCGIRSNLRLSGIRLNPRLCGIRSSLRSRHQ